MQAEERDRARVWVHIASCNTAPSTELCIRSMREFAGHPFELIVGDSGSSDGSVEMLRSFEAMGWLTLELAAGGRQHAEWLDAWLQRCEAALAVFVDSDVEFRRVGWLRDLVQEAAASGAALVCAEMLSEDPYFVEPVGGKVVRLSARPAPWLLLVDIAQAASLPVSFAFQSQETDVVPEGMVVWDVGARFFQEVGDRGLVTAEMSRSYQRKFHHYGGLSWLPAEGRRGRKKLRDLRTVELRLAALRARQEGLSPSGTFLRRGRRLRVRAW